MNIWCLFSVVNSYDQPENDLVCFWSTMPSLFELAKALGMSFPCEKDSDTLLVVNLWKGEVVKDWLNTNYRLQQVKEGVKL